MLQRNRNCKTVWRRIKNDNLSKDFLPIDPSFQQLKTVSKRLAIMSRLERKQMKNKTQNKINKTYSKIDMDFQKPQNRLNATQKRPATTNDKKRSNNIKIVQEVFREQKKINQYLIAEKYEPTVKTSFSQTNNNVKEGLLGEYDRYNQMTKQQLIEKLISLQYLANNIFRKNKALEQKIKNLQANQKIN